MKLTRKLVQRRARTLPRLQFADQQLSSFSGILLFQALFRRLLLKERLRACFRHLGGTPAYDRGLVLLGLIVHVLLGYRTLREMAWYRDDPMVLRLLGLRRLPDVATVSRALTQVDSRVIEGLRQLCRNLVRDRLLALRPRRVTLDFDGSVQGTCRHAEGSAVGYNRRKKGQRSYYPLLCTVAQTGQVFDVHHRPGNVHDSNGAEAFIEHCIREIRQALPGVVVEIRMDGAFFSDALVSRLREQGVEFTISVPFERFPDLKGRIEGRQRWWRVNDQVAYFELRWKPQSWKRRARFLAIRRTRSVQRKGPLQLDLFVPQAEEYAFKVVITNKGISPRHVVAFHEGRGAQEAIFGELKSEGQMDYVPVRTLHGNQAYLLATILAHNLSRELQMQVRAPQRRTTEKRAPLWSFERLATLRRRLVQRAGRLTWPQGVLTLTLGVGPAVQHDFVEYLGRLEAA
ncbi:MAG: IS1380 family transposase [Nitrospira sp.]|nr:IS1380 family transposase [Nitrospira sp.]